VLAPDVALGAAEGEAAGPGVAVLAPDVALGAAEGEAAGPGVAEPGAGAADAEPPNIADMMLPRIPISLLLFCASRIDRRLEQDEIRTAAWQAVM
jgi:hypothetical protein